MTLNGIDVSKWQRNTPPLTGLSFAFARATYATIPDPLYAKHVAAFRKADLVIGAYHFGVGFVTPAAQVKAFLAVAKAADLLVLDLERDTTKTMTRDQGREFIRLLRIAAPNKTILLYSSRGTWPGNLGQDANWVADYTGDPNRLLTWPRVKWAFWQYTSRPWDKNKFNGGLAELRRLANVTPAVTPAPIPKPVPVIPKRVLVQAGAWWDYLVAHPGSPPYGITRTSRNTKGFSASYGPILGGVNGMLWAGRVRKLVKLTSGAYSGRYVDLNDTGSISIISDI